MTRRAQKMARKVGDQIGFLTLLGLSDKPGRRLRLYRFRCYCGAEIDRTLANLGASISCGCKTRELLSAAKTSHGMSTKNDSPEYRTFICWQSMWWRCKNTNRSDYKDYGGRGITVCDRWKSFENFFSDMGLKPAGLTIERKDVNGNYEPSNCCWASVSEQARNRRKSRYIEANGECRLLCEWVERTGIPRDTLAWRIARWGAEKAVSIPYSPLLRKSA